MTHRRLADALGPIRGSVTVEARDRHGRLVHRTRFANAYTSLGATEHAKALAGEAANVALTHIGLGVGGVTITTAETTAGWTGATLDTGSFRQGVASLSTTAAPSGNAYAWNTVLIGAYGAVAGSSVECWMRLNFRGRFDLAASHLRVYTGGGANSWDVSLAVIEAANGAFQDATWKLVRIPIASFSAGEGAPTWSAVTGAGWSVYANASGAATLNVDDVRIVQPTIDVGPTAYNVPNEVSRKALSTLTRSGMVVSADAFWGMAEAVGQFYVAGLYAGSTLVAILPFTYYKAAGLMLRITWALTTAGG